MICSLKAPVLIFVFAFSGATLPAVGWSDSNLGETKSAPQRVKNVRHPHDATELSFDVEGIVNLLVTDPNGQQSGYDAAHGLWIQAIPGSGAGVDRIDDDETGAAGTPVQQVLVNSPASGTFKIALTGESPGAYSLNVAFEAADGSGQSTEIPGLSIVGVTTAYEVTYSPTPGTTPQVRLVPGSPGAVSPSQISVTSSGLAYSRVTQTFDSTFTIKNIGADTISGPFRLVFTSLPTGVRVVNATGTLAGFPFLAANSVLSLAAGQSTTVPVQFSNPSNATLDAIPVVYVGGD